MHKRIEDLSPMPGGGEALRSERWDEFHVGYSTTPQGDYTRLFAGFPDGACPYRHFGYVFEGRIRCRYPNDDRPDEVIEAGDAYFLEPGHVLIYEEHTRAFELNPADELEAVMVVMREAARSMAPPGDDPPAGE